MMIFLMLTIVNHLFLAFSVNFLLIYLFANFYYYVTNDIFTNRINPC